MSDLIGGLIGVAVGWGLSQATDFIKSKRRIRSLRKALTIELQDLEHLLKESCVTLKRNTDEYLDNRKFTYSVAKVSTPVLDTHYTELIEHFSIAQRANIRLLRAIIAHLNNSLDWLNNTDLSKLQVFDSFSGLIQLYRHALTAHTLLHECNKDFGQQELGAEHPIMVKLENDIMKIYEKLN